jgi:hypothetical protein
MLQASQPDSTEQQKPTMPKDEQKHCPLFKLPPELRSRIYSYATSQSEAKNKPSETELPLDKGNLLTYNSDPSENHNDHQSLPVANLNHISDIRPSNALLGTCQRIYEEARAMFVESQHTFWKTHAFLFDLHDDDDDDDDWTDEVSTAPQIAPCLHPRQIDSMPKFSIRLTTQDCIHTAHFIDNTLELSDAELNKGYVQSFGFSRGGCSHTGALSHTELRSKCHAFENDLTHSKIYEAIFQAHATKRRLARARTRMGAYVESARAYLDIAGRNCGLSKLEAHAVRRWEEERMRYVRTLEAQDVNLKQLLLTSVIQHLRSLYAGSLV